jgi:hypothetical protein
MLEVHQVDFFRELREFSDRSRMFKDRRRWIKRCDVEELTFFVSHKQVLLQHPSAVTNRQTSMNRFDAGILARPPDDVRFALICFRGGAIRERDISHGQKGLCREGHPNPPNDFVHVRCRSG